MRAWPLLFLIAAACGGEERLPPRPPVTTAPSSSSVIFRSDGVAGEPARSEGLDAGPLAPPPGPEPGVMFGPGSVEPGDPQPFRLAVALRALRASASGAKIATMLSLFPEVIDAKTKTGVDPFVHGEWLLVYGPRVEVPGPNANVLRHATPDAQVTKALAAAGFEARAGGVGMQAALYGARERLLRPQAGMLAMVPADRAADLAAALKAPVEPGTKTAELARMFLAEPAKTLHFLPSDVTRANVSAQPAGDGGLDLSADAQCLDAAACKAAAMTLTDFVGRQNSLVVRMVTRRLLSGLVIKGHGAKLEATLHATPEQVDAIVSLLRAQLGLPPLPARRP